MAKIENEEMIERIKEKAICRKILNKTIYIIKKDRDIPVEIQFIGKEFCQFKDDSITTVSCIFDTIENFYNKYIQHINDFLDYKEISKRSYGEPKLKKPNELKGIKPIFSITCGIRKNQIFKKNNDIWIKDNDYFSIYLTQEEAKRRGLKFKVREKFIYQNNFAPVILRGEGWICIKNLLLYIDDLDIKQRLCKEICNYYNWSIEEIIGDIERFYDELITKLRNMEELDE